MNAGKLIELLQKLPPDTEVLYYSEWKYLEYEPDETPSEPWRVDFTYVSSPTEKHVYSHFYESENSAKSSAKSFVGSFNRTASEPYKILAVY